MTNVMWRVARYVAGHPILLDPTEGKDGAWVFIRSGVTVSWIKAETFDMTVTTEIAPLEPSDSWARYEPGKRHGTFSGTVQS